MAAKACQCRGCGLRHRVGDYVIDVPGYGRRCLSESELRAKGWGPNKYDRWSNQKRSLWLTRLAKTDEIGDGALYPYGVGR